MGKELKLVKKLHRRERKVLHSQRKPDPDSRDLREEKMQNSQRIFSLFRRIKRRLSNWFGYNMLSHKPRMMADVIMDVGRFDYDPGAGTDYGLKCAPSASDFGIQPGDYVLFREGDLKGKELKVISVASADFRVEDVSTFVSENDVSSRLLLDLEKKSYS